MSGPRVETHQQKGTITTGKGKVIPVSVTVVDTYHADGRKDCTVKVPRVGTKTKAKGKS